MRCLRDLLSTGFMLLTGVPEQPGAVLEVVASFGYVRETSYGRLFDVPVEATSANLANTGLPIGPHTDNPYSDPAPTIQPADLDGAESTVAVLARSCSRHAARNAADTDALTQISASAPQARAQGPVSGRGGAAPRS